MSEDRDAIRRQACVQGVVFPEGKVRLEALQLIEDPRFERRECAVDVWSEGLRAGLTPRRQSTDARLSDSPHDDFLTENRRTESSNLCA